MKTISKLLFVVLILIATTSCKKDSSTSSSGQSYIRFSVNGTPIEYTGNTSLCAIIDPDDDTPIATISAYSSAAVLGSFIITIVDANLAEGSTYDLAASENTFGFIKDKTVSTAEGVITMDDADATGTLTITKVKQVSTVPFPTYAISGTFSGTGYNANGDAFTITNGQFYDQRLN